MGEGVGREGQSGAMWEGLNPLFLALKKGGDHAPKNIIARSRFTLEPPEEMQPF